MVEEFGARSVIDLGCGTGLLARQLAARGVTVAGVDPRPVRSTTRGADREQTGCAGS